MAMSGGTCDAVSISIVERGSKIRTVVSSAGRAAKADLLQEELAEGPSMSGVWEDDVLVASDLAGDVRWPRWAPVVAGWGFGSLVAVRLFGDSADGVLTLYSEHAAPEFDLPTVRAIAAQAAAVVARALRTGGQHRDFDTRYLIGQAQGVLMAKYGLSPGRAFALLHRSAQLSGVEIAVLAEELVLSGRLPDAGWLVGHTRTLNR